MVPGWDGFGGRGTVTVSGSENALLDPDPGTVIVSGCGDGALNGDAETLTGSGPEGETEPEALAPGEPELGEPYGGICGPASGALCVPEPDMVMVRTPVYPVYPGPSGTV